MNRRILKNFNLFVDGIGQAGRIEEYTPPEFVKVTEDFRAGGMDIPVPIELGMEPMEVSFKLVDYNETLLKKVADRSIPLTARGALEDSATGKTIAVVQTMRGMITKFSSGTWKPGEKALLEITAKITAYKEEHDGAVLIEIDAENMIRNIDGVDLLAPVRDALKL
jgi:P2 family phage contractile tail tube protein